MAINRRDFLKLGAAAAVNYGGGGTPPSPSGLIVDLADWNMVTTPPPVVGADIRLRDFIRAGWHVVEPATPFAENWHIDAIADHLEAVTNGHIRNLLVNMPPRHMKSLCISVFWPVWSWLRDPASRWLFSSYSSDLSQRDSVKARRLIESPWFQREYGHIFQLTGDQNTKNRYENDKTGYRISTSVGGKATGEGGDYVVVDDPHKASEASSDVKRRGVLEWWDETMSSRLNDQKTGRKVIVMQRLHENDLSGHVLEKGNYVHLLLPAEYDSRRAKQTAIGFVDPRRNDGDLLWPKHIGPTEIASLKTELGSYGYAGQYQQTPVPRGGGVFKADWWQYWHKLPPLRSVIVVGDTAQKEGLSNDYSVFAVWAEGVDGNFYLLDLWRERAAFGKLTRGAHTMYYRWQGDAPLTYQLVVEDKNSGVSLIQTMRRPYMLTDDAGQPERDADGNAVIHPAITIGPFPRHKSPREAELARLDKESRANAVVALVENRRVFVPANAPWLAEWLSEHSAFPNGTHDDQVDTTSIALIRLYLTPKAATEKPKRSIGTQIFG